jgi:gliding motility-associated-like protein/uncharacterized repeat protein (TIGR01451 family)
VVILDKKTSLTVTKTADVQVYTFVGDVVNYTIRVQNTGNTTLKNIVVTDELTGLNTAGQGFSIPVLLPGEIIEFNKNNSNYVSYTITKADLATGVVTNIVRATGNDTNGNPVNAQDTLVIEKAIVLGCESILVHNSFTPNGDGINDKFEIENIEPSNCYPDNSIEIYNRWGVLVFETKNYDNTTNFFDGYSKGRTTINSSEILPTGTYYYILNYSSVDGNGDTQINKKDGFLYLAK